jgi:23S rRNA (cytidine1920-2'-O)/16S rRNA (cytidine1409-2'-O)-methyltransferase
MSQRLDIYLVQNGHFPARDKARMAIEAGVVTVNGRLARKAGQTLQPSDIVVVAEHDLTRYVSLGGLKLAYGLQQWPISVEGLTVLDVGASTGGFTDCLLQHGAKHIIAVDAGTDQMHPVLRADGRVEVYENTNLRDLDISTSIDAAVMDVSFTSQIPLLPMIRRYLPHGSWLVSLIKPQFELDRKIRFTNGIVNDPKLHTQAVQLVRTGAMNAGFLVQDIIALPVLPNKNQEFLGWFIVA